MDDLPDWGYRDAYDDEVTPSEAAQEILEENGFDSFDFFDIEEGRA
jgi:hypothetical protein